MSLSFILSIITIYLMALLAMAFYTLVERKALGYFQLRKGPNKVGIMGLPQPLADALKLFAKEQAKPINANFMPFLFAPISSLILTLILWSLFPLPSPTFFIPYGVLMFLCISSLNVYTTLSAGWASNSKYALLGALRSIAQTISYEVSLALILMGLLCIQHSFNLHQLTHSPWIWPAIMSLPLLFTWFVSCLAETNRTPFDFAEGESELVSGFNVEYSSGGFALIFMAEYANILLMSLLTIVFFMSSETAALFSGPLLMLKTAIVAFLFIWVRATMPRMRYDRLMNLTWKSFLPMSISFLVLNTAISSLIL
nr:NADH dehydrogenase subunit 1 [Abarenicola claparedi oceanica]